MSRPLSRRTFTRLLLGGAAATMLRPLRAVGGTPAHATAVRHSTYVMGQVATITAYGAPEPVLREAITEAFNALRKVDALMSVFSDTSDVGRINGAPAHTPVAVDPWTVHALLHAAHYSDVSHGAFDHTVEPLMRVWGFREKRSSMPSDAELAAAYDAVGVDNIRTDPTPGAATVHLRNARTKIDLGGSAVGCALEHAAACLIDRGVTSALIDVSGDMVAIGAPPDADGWEVGIVDPLHTDSCITKYTIRDQALATSGNYASFVEYNAVRFGHIMDPQDGHPAHALASATVIARRGHAADALSTAAFIDPSLTIAAGTIIRVRTTGEVVTS